MSWAAIASAIVKGLAALFQYMQNRQLLDAGKAEQKAADQGATLDAIRKANQAAEKLPQDAEAIGHDPNNLDR